MSPFSHNRGVRINRSRTSAGAATGDREYRRLDVSGFHHEAVFYADHTEYAADTLPEIRRTLASDGVVLVAVADARAGLLREALGVDAARVVFTDMRALGRNPACIIPRWREFLSDAGPEPVLGIGEPVWPGRSDAELVECSRHESLLNLAFDGGRDWRLLCPYDAAALEPDVIDEACRNHPHVRWNGASRTSDDYGGDAARAWDEPLPAPEQPAAELPFTQSELAVVRSFAADRARRAGVDTGRVPDLVLAVNELATNSLRHGGGSGLLRTWEQDGALCCEVCDDGRIEDPLAGRERADGLGGGGRGLWIVNHLCDLVQVRPGVVRVHVSLN
jgi:anti-sigma regulatory factor (Ser/Thr protein kinase)